MRKYNVYLSPVAEVKLNLLLEQIAKKWGNETKTNFLASFTKKVNLIADYPKSCPFNKSFGGIYKCVVSKQTSFFYRIIFNEIEILTITDNRQDPKKISQELKKLSK